MANEIEIWALDGGGKVKLVKPLAGAESEEKLEDTLVKNPHLLMPDLKLVGRQLPTPSGPLDLLGLDAKGRLVVFELKRGRLAREAVTQVIDYASSLESMSNHELVKHITERSGHSGIERIREDEFDDWYTANIPDQEGELKPVQMTLVGLGADADAIRMVEFLAENDMPIKMLTFHGYDHDGKTLLAKHVQAERDVAERGRSQTIRDDKKKNLDKRIAEFGISEFWDDVCNAFEGRETVVNDGFNFSRGHMKLPDHDKGFNVALSIRLTPERTIRIIFSPVSIHLCQNEFDKWKGTIGFREEEPGNQPKTNKITKQWVLDLNYEMWKTHKERLVTLADSVGEEWRKLLRSSKAASGTGVYKESHAPPTDTAGG